MNFKGLFLILAVFLCSFVACNAVSAANHTVVWQDNRNGGGTSIKFTIKVQTQVKETEYLTLTQIKSILRLIRSLKLLIFFFLNNI